MLESVRRRLVLAAAGISLMGLAGCSPLPRGREAAAQAKADLGFLDIDAGMTLRRMVVRSLKPKGTVLLLHGFPETLHAWKEVAVLLGRDHEIHAFDWPGYGLSSRPSVDRFSYAPRDYAWVLKEYIKRSGIDTSRLVIYATDIGALPALLLALDEPDIAKTIIVGDFAPFDRSRYMHAGLQSLKFSSSSDATRAHMNRNRDEILENAFRRGLHTDEQFEISREFKDDMLKGWSQHGMSSADAFYHYYSHFTRDQDYLESNVDRLKTPVKVVWGEKDFYIDKEMGVEFAGRIGVKPTILNGVGHYPHLQSPRQTAEEIRTSINQ